MDNKVVLFGKQAMEALAAGIDIVANAVKCTLGYGGRVVIISEISMPARSTKDGVTVANSIKLKNEAQFAGAKIIKEVSYKTAEEVGDGTTTVCVIMQKIVSEGIKHLGHGVSPVDLKRGIDYVVSKVVSFVDANKKMATKELLRGVATVSANNDTEIGSMIGDVYMELDKHAVISVEDSKNGQTHIEYAEGFYLPSGYVSQHFVNNTENNNCELENPYILLVEGKITDANKVINIMNFAARASRPLVVIAEDFDYSVLATMIKNIGTGAIKSCLIKYGFIGETKQELMYDIAAITGAVIAESRGDRMETLSSEYLGSCKRIVISRDETIIYDGGKVDDLVSARIKDASVKIENARNPFEKQKQEKRMARLSGKIAICRVGGASDVEISEKKDRIDDSIRATKAAMEDGVVAGGGTILLRASAMDFEGAPEGDALFGVAVMRKALAAPFEQIIENCGVSGFVTAKSILEYDSLNIGYDAKRDEVCDLFDSSVVDPSMVIKSCVKNAASAACQILLCQSVIVSEV